MSSNSIRGLDSSWSRRRFLAAIGSSAAASAAASAARPALPQQGRKVSANDRLQIGVIGLGSRGFNLVDELLKARDARIVAICDVHELHYRDRPWGTGAAFGRTAGQKRIDSYYERNAAAGAAPRVDVVRDYREICKRADVDAVVIATPDHWHALCTLEAVRNDKDVYCEKPVTHLFGEGQAIYRAVEKHGTVFQTGSQQRSDALFQRAVNLAWNGVLGNLQRAEIGLPPGYDKPQGETKIREIPEGLNYERWCGPAPKLPYMRARHHRWWRGHRAYGGGVLMDWIGHHNDIAHWALGMDPSGPTRIEAVDWTFPESTVYDTPHQYSIRCEFDGGIESSISSSNLLGTKLIGDEGWVHVTRGRITASDPRWTRPDFKPGKNLVPESPGHMRNFLDCMRNRKTCIAPAQTAHRSITPGHVGYLSLAAGEPIRWDPKAERVLNSAELDKQLKQVSYREPWSLEG